MRILGISCYYHDSAAALIDDGRLVACAEEERFTRIKHDRGFPNQAVDFCLETGGLRPQDLDYVVFYEKPFLKFERLFLSILETFPRSCRLFREQAGPWLLNKLWVKSHIAQKLSIPQDRILFAEHHQSHAASAFFCSPFEEAAVLTVDGVGEWTSAAIGVAQGSPSDGTQTLRLTHEMKFPFSLGLFYSAITAFLGFEVNEGEYKVMGMAAYGKPDHVEKIRKILKMFDDGSFDLDLSYFAFPYDTERSFSSKLEALLGPPRQPGAPFDVDAGGDPAILRESRHYADIAASAQQVTEEVVVRMAQHARRLTGSRHLCMAGGVALNGMANYRVLREAGFEKVYIHPAPGDSGGAVGAALYVYHVLLNKPRRVVMDHVFWGKEYDDAAVRSFLERSNIAYSHFDDEKALLEIVIGRLQEGHVVGWHQGRFEWGPRALGNRSILADPRRADMKAIVNSKIKYREPFRPFAPSLPAAHVSKYFDLSSVETLYPAHFMQIVVPVREEQRDRIPATTHQDGTARLQAVLPHTNPRYHRLLELFGQATGVPVLLNTSFNVKGEPIVSSPEDSFRCFSQSGMEELVIGNCLIEKSKVWRNHPTGGL